MKKIRGALCFTYFVILAGAYLAGGWKGFGWALIALGVLSLLGLAAMAREEHQTAVLEKYERQMREGK